MNYFYHYAAIAQKQFGTSIYIEGTYNSDVKITDRKSYETFHLGVAEKSNLKDDEIIITSITLLHSEEP